MSTKILLVFLLVSYSKAQENELCPCDTAPSKEAKNMLNILLEKLSSKVSEDEEERLFHSVYPGLLAEYECSCEEKMRRKRKIFREQPEVISEVEANPEEPKEREKKFVHNNDRRCPLGSVKYLDACLPEEDFEDY